MSGIESAAAAKILNRNFGRMLKPNLMLVSAPLTTTQFTVPVPADIIANGGIVYVSGTSGGGGGGGGWSAASGGGGGGGSGSGDAYLLPLYVPSGYVSLYCQVGAGGLGGAAGAAGAGGGETYIRIGSHSGEYLLRIKGGGGGATATATNGGAGAAEQQFALSGGAGGAGAANGSNAPNWLTVNFVGAGMHTGGSGGGGAGATAPTGGGTGSNILTGWTNGGAGAGAGGAGGSTVFTVPQFSATNPPMAFCSRTNIATDGRGGAGGGSPTAGAANTQWYGGGGGGGGTGFAGGAGMDGFLLLMI